MEIGAFFQWNKNVQSDIFHSYRNYLSSQRNDRLTRSFGMLSGMIFASKILVKEIIHVIEMKD